MYIYKAIKTYCICVNEKTKTYNINFVYLLKDKFSLVT